MKKLNVALIGAGAWGRNHARVLSALDNVNLIAACDVNADAAKGIGLQYGIEYTDNLDALLANASLDAVTVCTPPTTHRKVAVKALEAGKQVFVEKPLTHTAADAEALLATAKDLGLRVMPGHIERFNPAVMMAKKLIGEGKLGSIVSALAERIGPWSPRILDVGVLLDTAIHDIDLSRYIFEDEIQSVYAQTGNLKHRNTAQHLSDYVDAILIFRGGEIAIVHSNWLSPVKRRRLTITGSEAAIELDCLTKDLWLQTPEGVFNPTIDMTEPLKAELESFADCLLDKKPFVVDGKDGLMAVRICEGIETAAKTGRYATVSDID